MRTMSGGFARKISKRFPRTRSAPRSISGSPHYSHPKQSGGRESLDARDGLGMVHRALKTKRPTSAATPTANPSRGMRPAPCRNPQCLSDSGHVAKFEPVLGRRLRRSLSNV